MNALPRTRQQNHPMYTLEAFTVGHKPGNL